MIAHGLALTATAGLLLAGPAAADTPAPSPEPDPITITLTPEQSARVCAERIPRLLQHLDDLTARITGDADTVGSVANLQRRADEARGAGRDALATQLDERADRRELRVEQLATLTDRVEAFDAEHCP